MCIYVEVWTRAKNCDQSLKVDHAALKTMQEPPVLFKMATVSLYLHPRRRKACCSIFLDTQSLYAYGSKQ